MRGYSLTDDFGRRTVFTGTKLVCESTDTVAGTKPQWQDVEVYRTESSRFVVRRITHYRIRHTTDHCSRAEGYELIDATLLDTYACPECNPHNKMDGGLGQADRIVVDVYQTPGDLTKGFQDDKGRYSHLARAVLADVAEQDKDVDLVWNTVVVP